MKKVYIPTINELYQMQEMGANVYKYLTVKAIECLIVEGVNSPNKGILKNAYKYLKENPDIAYSICSMYPEEIQYSETAQNNVNLCCKLIRQQKDTTIYSLDNLALFQNGVGTLDNYGVVNNTINVLKEYLPKTPEYRFQYQENTLLDNIFGKKINNFTWFNGEAFRTIEPAYTLETYNKDVSEEMIKAVNNYAARYNINPTLGVEYRNTDILTKPEQKTKRLLKCIKENGEKY